MLYYSLDLFSKKNLDNIDIIIGIINKRNKIKKQQEIAFRGGFELTRSVPISEHSDSDENLDIGIPWCTDQNTT